ncbi:MAG: VPS10 domain-containing protein [Cyclobacteriaceae bacterium]
MKRILFLVSAFILCAVGLIQFDQFTADLKRDKVAYTPEQLWQEYYQEKALLKNDPAYNKADQPEKFAEYHQLIRTRSGQSKPGYKVNYRVKALQQAQERKSKLPNARSQHLNFIERGPGNVPGRTRAVAAFPASVDPDSDTWLAGSVGGGIWKTTNAGTSWTNTTEDLPNLAITSIAICESNPNVVYAGTGEGWSGTQIIGVIGDGILKSTDGGDSWTQLVNTTGNEDFQNVNRVIVNPDNPNVVLACSSNDALFGTGFDSGIFKSTDGGSNWARVYTGNQWVQQLVAAPGDFDVIFATLSGSGVLKSTDQGQTWTNSSNGIVPGGRIELAIAPTDPSRLYASVVGTQSGNESDLYVSSDAGTVWSLLVEEDNGENFDHLGGQGGYDNTIAVNPFDEDVVYFGGVNLFKMTLKPGEALGDRTVLGVELIDTEPFVDFVNFDSGEFFENKLATGNAPESEFVSIEIRFGPGISQKAHRFTVPTDGGSNGDGGPGVPDADYIYEDYVDVPFQVWDIDNNRQLMASFRDQQRDGLYNLIERKTDGPATTHSREYLFVNAVDYAETPAPSLAQKGGQAQSQLYFMWPTLREGATWNPSNLPNSKIAINYGAIKKRFRATENISDAYNNFDGKNSYSQGIGTTDPAQFGFHPDHHNLIMIPVNSAAKTFKILNSNDGGVYVTGGSNNPGVIDNSWKFSNGGYNTSQFYGADKKPGSNEYIGGMQDNGTFRSPSNIDPGASTFYTRQLSGDGFGVAWHALDPNRIIGSTQYNGFRSTKDGGASWQSAQTGLEDNDADTAPFITRLSYSKKNPSVLFAVGASGVWKSPDFGDSWKSIPITTDWGYWNLTSVSISEADPKIVWAGSGMNTSTKIHVSTNGGNSFSSVNNYTQVELGQASGLATHPTEENTAYALFSFANAPKILRTKDLGQNWEDISGFNTNSQSSNGFPDVAVFSLLVLPNQPTTIWAGTEIGIFESIDDGASWSLLDDFINVSVWQMKAMDDQIIIATHGRGIWSVAIDGMKWPDQIITGFPDPNPDVKLGIKIYPNPVIKRATFRYTVPVSTRVHFEIISSDGKLVESLDFGLQKKGEKTIVWQRKSHASGVYFVRLITDVGQRAGKIVLE